MSVNIEAKILTKLYSLAMSLGAESSIVAENSITFVIWIPIS